MGKEDRESLVEFYHRVTREDARYLWDDVTNKDLMRSWVDSLDYKRMFPLVALIDGRIVGNLNLYLHRGPTRHLGHLRIFTDKDFRGKGLATIMLQEIMTIAKTIKLKQLWVEIPLENIPLVRLLQKVGFQLQAHLKDYFMTYDGKTHDVALLSFQLD